MTTNRPYQQLIKSISMLLALTILVYSCGQKKESTKDKDQIGEKNPPAPVSYDAMSLNMPKDEETGDTITRPYAPSMLTVLVLGGDTCYCYSDTALAAGAYCNKKILRAVLRKNKAVWGDSLYVIIKPAEKATYADAVDVLDEMQINSIPEYTITKLSKKEENYFGIASSNMLTGQREELTVTVPDTRSSTITRRNDGSLLIRMGEDGQIFVKINDGKSKDILMLIDKTKKEGLSLAIAAYRQDYPKGEILISGSANAKYEDFMFIVDILKAKDELKYRLVTEY